MSRSGISLQLQSEKALVSRQVPSERILKLELRAPDAPKRENRIPLNLALVLDRSGSMAGQKMAYVKQAAQHVVDLLAPEDRAALVVYDNNVDLLAPSRSMDRFGKKEILQRIRTIDAGGMTYLSGGWLMGCEQVAGAASNETLNRVLLLTDGLANQGITEPEELRMHAQQLSLRGVSTSTFGVGEGFNEHLLEGIANRGGGNFYYIGRPEEIPGIFHREFSELVTVTARKVELEFTIPPNVDVQVKGEWTHERGGNRLLVTVGELLGGRPQEIYLKLLIPPFQAQPDICIAARVRGAGADGMALEDAATFAFTYADQTIVSAAPLQPGVMESYAAVHLGDVVTEALKLERAGKFDQANQLLDSELSRHIADLSSSDQVLYQTVAKRMKRGMSESDRKEAHFQSYLNKRRKNQDQ